MDVIVTKLKTMTDRKARLKEVLKKVAMQHKDVYKSRSALARAMDIPIQVLGTYFRGDSFPDRDNFVKIASFLGLTVVQLESLLDDATVDLPLTDTKKADDIIPVVLQLPDSEKFALLKYLVNTLEYA